MMKDMLDMVNFVADSHSMSDALDTYDTIFRSRSSYSIDSSGSNNVHVNPWMYDIPGDPICMGGGSCVLLLPDE